MFLGDAMNTAFDWWVANTIQTLGGNGALYLQGIQRERALTFIGTRMNACQGGFERFGKVFFLDSARRSMRVNTHKRHLF